MHLFGFIITEELLDFKHVKVGQRAIILIALLEWEMASPTYLTKLGFHTHQIFQLQASVTWPYVMLST